MAHWVRISVALSALTFIGAYISFGGGTSFGGARADEYAFIGKLGGKPRNVDSYEVAKGNEVQGYGFDQSPDEVRKAATAELGKPTLDVGFTMSIWIRNTKSGRVRVTIFHAVWKPGDNAMRGAMILEGPHEAIASIGAKYGWRNDLPYTAQDFFPHPDGDVYFCAFDHPYSEKTIIDEYTWCNVSDSDATLVLEDYQKNQYDSVEPLPMSIQVPAVSEVKMRLTLPLESEIRNGGGGDDGDCMSYHYVTPDGVSHSQPGDHRLQEHDLHISIEPTTSPGKRRIVLFINRDITGRPLEVKSIKVTMDGAVVFDAPGPWRSKSGAGLKIPFAFVGDRGDRKVHVDVDYRVVPNTRWRTAGQG